MGLHFSVGELVFYLLAEAIAMKLYYFGGLNHSKPDIQLPYYLIKANFLVHILMVHMACVYIFALSGWF